MCLFSLAHALAHDRPTSSLICWIVLAVLVLYVCRDFSSSNQALTSHSASRFTAVYLAFLNKRHAARRRRAGKTATVVDTSLETAVESARLQIQNEENGRKEGADASALNGRAFDDLTDVQNEDFIYVL